MANHSRIEAYACYAYNLIMSVRTMDGVRRPIGALQPLNLTPNPSAVLESAAVMSTLPAHVPAAVVPARPKLAGIAFSLIASGLFAVSSSALAVHEYQQFSANQAAATAPAPKAAPAAPAAAPVRQESLQSMLEAFNSHHAGKYAIVVKDLKTGETGAVNASRSMTSASLYKLFVAAKVYQRVDAGQTSLSAPAGRGTGRTVGSCTEIMIDISDNECGRALATILGWGRQDAELQKDGYTGTKLSDPQMTSAGDAARLLERLYNGSLLSPGMSGEYLKHLKDQRVRDRLPKGLPVGTEIAHKTGDLNGYVHDAGIIYGPKTDYLVVMMSGPHGAPESAKPAFGDLNAKLWARLQR